MQPLRFFILAVSDLMSVVTFAISDEQRLLTASLNQHTHKHYSLALTLIYTGQLVYIQCNNGQKSPRKQTSV